MKDFGFTLRIILFVAVGCVGVTGCITHQYLLLSMIAAVWGLLGGGICIGAYLAAPEPKPNKSRKQ